ncbi:MAG: lipopolysaccharide biosynthesis protein [Clostridia bacterium]
MKEKSTIINAIAMFIGTGLNILISLISTPIITRLVSPTAYGQWSLFTTYSTVGMAVIMLGLDQAFVRFYYNDNSLEFKRYLTFTAVKIPISIGLISIILTVPFIRKTGLFESENWTIYILLYINVILLIMNRISHLVLRMEQKGIAYSSLLVINKVIFIISTFVMICSRRINHAIALTAATVIAQLIVTVAGIVMGRNNWRFFPKKPSKCKVNMRSLIIYGLPFIYTMLATDIFNATDKWAINAIKTSYEVGIYAAASNIVAICSVIKTTFDLLWAPAAMKHYEQEPENTGFYTKINGCITVVMYIISIVVICFKDIIVLFLGENYRIAITIVPLLLFNPIMTTVSETTVYGLNFKKKTGYHIIITTVSCIVNILLNVVLIPIYSAEGAALATAISYIVFFIMRTIMGIKAYPANFNLGKFFVVTILFFIIAFLNTFFNVVVIINIIFMIIFVTILIALYKEYVYIMIETFKNQIIKIYKRERRI